MMMRSRVKSIGRLVLPHWLRGQIRRHLIGQPAPPPPPPSAQADFLNELKALHEAIDAAEAATATRRASTQLSEWEELRERLRTCEAAALAASASLAELASLRHRLAGYEKFAPPGHFYSPLPDLDAVARREASLYAPNQAFAGIDLRDEAQLELLKTIAPLARDLPFPDQPRPEFRYHYKNDFYSYGDAAIYAGMVRHFRPRRVVEIGSGYSSALLLDLNQLYANGEIECTFVDPYPEQLNQLLRPGDRQMFRIEQAMLQDVDPGIFAALQSGDILFVDSSHITKIGSDVNHLVFEVLPRLARGVIVHFHDVFDPFHYPLAWFQQGRAWNEIYLLRAFLQFNSAFEILYFNHYMGLRHTDALTAHLPLALRKIGGALWLRKTADPPAACAWPPRTSGSYLEAEPWIISQLTVSELGVEVSGWAFPPIQEGAAARFTINGRPCDIVEYPQPIPSFRDSFWMRPRAEESGYRIETRQSHGELFRDGHLAITFDFPGRPGRAPYHSTWYYRDPELQLTLPDVQRRYRVIGSESIEMFCLGGYTDFMRMNALLEDRFQLSYRQCRRILDWGCGCGRVARYFATVPEVEFHGGDIDPDNIAWCRDNLTFGQFHPLPLRPPTTLSDAMFDLVYGISVFTHLREEVQFAWLQELHRILRPGGIALVTIHGPTTLNFARMPADQYRTMMGRIQTEGFVITSGNDQINGVIEDQDYYVNVAHSHSYIRKRWSHTFDIVDIIPGFIWTHDLVVMRKRA